MGKGGSQQIAFHVKEETGTWCGRRHGACRVV